MIVIFGVALAARAGFGIVRLEKSTGPSRLEFPDEHQYWFMAQSLASGNGLCDEMGFRATRMPLYPAILSLCVDLPNSQQVAKASQWIVGAIAAIFILSLGNIIAGRWVGIVAGMIVALDPFLIFFASLLLTETGAITALCFLWLLLARILFQHGPSSWTAWLVVGVAAAVCVYFRESNLGLAVLGIVFVVAARHFDRRCLLGGAVALGLVALSLVPWAVRNRWILGESCWLTTRGGISLYDGVGPQATGASDLGAVQRKGEAATLPEAQWNEYFRTKAWAAIHENPGRIVQLAGQKLRRMWNPFPNVESYQSRNARWISAIWTIPLFFLAFVGAVRRIATPRHGGLTAVLFLLLPAIYLSVLHSLYVGSVRYRLPAMPMIALLAAVSLSSQRYTERAHENE